jgi:beta,beta-carotene 9',10'-dioxygenase
VRYDFTRSTPTPPTTPEDGPAYALGFETLESEVEVDRTTMTGSMPGWLSGTLVRTGPAKFEVGTQKYNHWFDGLGMLHRFSLSNGEVSYGNKFIQSRAYMHAMENDQISFREFATDPDPELYKYVSQGFEPHGTDNAIVNVVKIKDKILATTQMPLPIEFDPSTLKTIGTFDYEDNLPDGFTTPHPMVDGNYLYNFNISLDPPVSHNLYRFDGTKRELMSTIPSEAPSFVNSFAMTERFIIFVEQPYRLDYMKLIAGGTAFANCFDWHPEEPSRFWIIDKDDGEILRTFETDPFFFLHHINAYQDQDGFVIDMVTYKDPQIIKALYLDNLRTGGSIPVPQARRFRLSLDDDQVYSEPLRDAFVELPHINDAFNGKPYRYFYGFGGYGSVLAGAQLTYDFANAVVKVDVSGGPTKIWQVEGCFPGDPIFVPRPGSTEEDDGVLLSVVLDSDASRSFLLVLDARSMAELARADLPHHIPFSLGGNFFSDADLREAKPVPAPAAAASSFEAFLAGLSAEDSRTAAPAAAAASSSSFEAYLAGLSDEESPPAAPPTPAAQDSTHTGPGGWLKRFGGK